MNSLGQALAEFFREVCGTYDRKLGSTRKTADFFVRHTCNDQQSAIRGNVQLGSQGAHAGKPFFGILGRCTFQPYW